MKTLRDGHIGYNEAIALAVTFIASKIFFTFPGNMVRHGDTAVWLLTILSGFFAGLGWLIIDRLMSRFPGKSLVEVSEEAAGCVIGCTLSLGVFLFFMVINATVLREFTETIIATILPQTPISIVTIAVLIGVLYASYLGLEAVARTCFLMSPFILVALVALMAGVLPFAKLYFLAPFLGPGPVDLVKDGAILSSYFGEILVLALIFPAFRKPGNFKKVGMWALIIALVLMTGIVMIFKMVFPHPEAIATAYPMYQMARLVTFGRFVQRVESILFFIWIFGALLSLSIGFYASAVTLARTLRLPVYRPLLFPLAILLFSVSLLAPDFLTSLRLDENYLANWGTLPAFGIPLLLLFLAVVRKKGGGQNG